jgi:hypothetical protein
MTIKEKARGCDSCIFMKSPKGCITKTTTYLKSDSKCGLYHRKEKG